MTTDPHRERLARGTIKTAVLRLASGYPFHAKVVERFDIYCQPAIDTVGVTVVEDTVQLHFNPEFILGITLDELVGVLLHEVHHVVLGHVVANPEDFPDEQARTIAEEVTANEFIHEPLPGDPITLDRFPLLQPMESTRERYKLLADQSPRDRILNPITAKAGKSGRPTDRGRPGARVDSGLVQTLDDHALWQQAAGDRRRAQSAIQAVVQDAVIEVGGDEVPIHLWEAIEQLVVGLHPGVTQSRFDAVRGGNLDWVRLLRQYIGRLLRPQPDFLRPPRRFPQLLGIVPGRRRRGGRPRVMGVIDSSGSLTEDLLRLISGELGRMASQFQVTIVECDTEIHGVYPFRPITTVTGRGGTDLRPPLAPKFLSRHQPELVVYFTDGFGPAPANPPKVPVIWCLTPDGTAPVGWGRVVRMSESVD